MGFEPWPPPLQHVVALAGLVHVAAVATFMVALGADEVGFRVALGRDVRHGAALGPDLREVGAVLVALAGRGDVAAVLAHVVLKLLAPLVAAEVAQIGTGGVGHVLAGGCGKDIDADQRDEGQQGERLALHHVGCATGKGATGKVMHRAGCCA